MCDMGLCSIWEFHIDQPKGLEIPALSWCCLMIFALTDHSDTMSVKVTVEDRAPDTLGMKIYTWGWVREVWCAVVPWHKVRNITQNKTKQNKKQKDYVGFKEANLFWMVEKGMSRWGKFREVENQGGCKMLWHLAPFQTSKTSHGWNTTGTPGEKVRFP